MPVGRPLKYKTNKALEKVITEYFDKCDANSIPYTITGLGLEIGLDRHQLIRYGNKEQFSHTIKKAKLRCENYAEISLFKGKNVAGAIFNLKNNYKGWKDKTESEHSGSLPITVVTHIPRSPVDR